MSHTTNKWENRSSTGLNTNEEYLHQRRIPVVLVLICDHFLSFFVESGSVLTIKGSLEYMPVNV